MDKWTASELKIYPVSANVSEIIKQSNPARVTEVTESLLPAEIQFLFLVTAPNR
jgi:hypothetical protein